MKDLFEGNFVKEVCAIIPEMRKLFLVLGVAFECCILPQALYLKEIFILCEGIILGVLGFGFYDSTFYIILYSLNLLVKVLLVIVRVCKLEVEPRKSLMHPLCVFVSIFLSSSHCFHCFLLSSHFLYLFTYFGDLSKVYIS